MITLKQSIIKLWYSPAINLGCRVTSIVLMVMGIGYLFDQVMMALTLTMTFPAAFICGLDTAGPRRWLRFLITASVWSLSLFITYFLFTLAIPLWITFFVLAGLYSFLAVNGAFWARLGISCLVISGVSLSLYLSNAPGYQYSLLVIGPLIFAVLSWVWFLIWKNFALKVCVSAIYQHLADYIQLREAILFGDMTNTSTLIKNKHTLINLFQQASQTEVFISKRNNIKPLFDDLYLAQDIFEVVLSSHTTNPDLLDQFKNDKIKKAALTDWSHTCQQLLREKSERILSEDVSSLSPVMLINKAEYLIQLVTKVNDSRIEYWTYAISHISKRIASELPIYERSYQVQPFELSWSWPQLNSPIWRHVFRMAIMFGSGTAIAEYADFMRPDWVIISMIMVIQPGFLATKSRIWQRCLGTCLGGLFAYLILSINLPVSLLVALCLFLLPFSMLQIMKNYSVAIGGITVLLIVSYQLLSHQGMAIIVPRLQDNILGSLIVLMGFGLLWPQWKGKELHQQSIKGIEAAKNTFLFIHSLLVEGAKESDLVDLSTKRTQLLMAESQLVLAFSDMQKEPRYTHVDAEYYEELTLLYRQLSHYLCLLIPLIREGVQCRELAELQESIEGSTNALLKTIKEESFTVMPYIHIEDRIDITMFDLKTKAACELVWRSLLVIEGMNDTIIRNRTT